MDRHLKAIQYSGFTGLGAAIILQAAVDYRRSVEYISKNKDADDYAIKKCVFQKFDCEMFFCGRWFAKLCNLSGREVLASLSKESGG